MQPPQLLYHSDTPTLYPTNTSSSLITVRFPSAVRITSLRITPEGVASPSGPGTTYPSRWTGEIYLNASDASPVNALERRNVEYAGGEWPVDYDVGMPDDVTTRLISLLAPVQSITLSIYGYHAAGPSHPAVQHEPTMHKAASEDLAWVSAWAGGVGGLLDMLGSNTESERKRRVVECLELLQEHEGTVIPLLLERNAALSYLLRSHPGSNLVQQIFGDPDHALHPSLSTAVSSSHPLYILLTSTDDQRRHAWRHIEFGWLPLHVLSRSKEGDLMAVEEGQGRSNLARLLDSAELYAAKEGQDGGRCLELILDILGDPPLDRVVLAHLAGVVPRLTVVSAIRNGSKRSIQLPVDYAPTIARALFLCSSEVIDSRLAFPAAQRLVQPFLPHLPPDSPYHAAFSTASQAVPSLPTAGDADSRRLSRLLSAASSAASSASSFKSSPSALVHSATPADLIQILAPSLYALLATAPVPLLDIPTLANPTPDSQASAWAGKVYTSNAFREREEARVGLGIKGAKIGGLAVLSGGSSAGGLGVGNGAGTEGQGRLSRPASRHVDDYVR